MNNSIKIRKIVVISVLAAIIIVLQVLGNLFGSLFANGLALGLIPICIGSILYGPFIGMLLGGVMSAVIMLHFPNYSIMETGLDTFKLMLIMVIKTPLAGFVSGLIFDLFNKIASKKANRKSQLALITAGIFVSSIAVVIVNTGTYVLMMLSLFTSGDGFNLNNLVGKDLGGRTYNSAMSIVLLYQVGFNFILELIIAFVTGPALSTIIRVMTRRKDMGYRYNFSELLKRGGE